MLRKCSSGVKITRLLMSSGRYDLPRNGSVTRDGVAVAFCKMREIQHTGCKCLLSHHSLEYQRKNDAPSSTRPLFHPKVRNFGRVAMEIVNRSPPVIQPYLKLLRIDRPIGKYLLIMRLSLFNE